MFLGIYHRLRGGTELQKLLGVRVWKKLIDNPHSMFNRQVVDDVAPKIKKNPCKLQMLRSQESLDHRLSRSPSRQVRD